MYFYNPSDQSALNGPVGSISTSHRGPSKSLSLNHWPSVAAVVVTEGDFMCSVEALASALVPVAVDHQSYDDEEEEAKHGEEHSEEDGNATHPFPIIVLYE